MSEVVITSVGAVSPVGLDALATAAALRAGVSRLADAPEAFVPAGAFGVTAEPAIAARVPGLPLALAGAGRDEAMLAPAIAEALARDAAPVDLVILASRGPLAPEAHPSLGGAAFESVPGAQTAALNALARAADAIRQRRASRVLVAAAESRAEPLALRSAAAEGRLKSSLRPDGLLPGEGAAALIVESAASARARGIPALARVMGTGASVEPEPLASRATGITRAVREALGERDAATVVIDLNGERARARDWSLAAMRAMPFREAQRDLWHPAEGIGDAGAGAGALLLVVAALALARGHIVGNALVVASDDAGARAACLLGAADRIALVPGEPPLAWVAR